MNRRAALAALYAAILLAVVIWRFEIGRSMAALDAAGKGAESGYVLMSDPLFTLEWWFAGTLGVRANTAAVTTIGVVVWSVLVIAVWTISAIVANRRPAVDSAGA